MPFGDTCLPFEIQQQTAKEKKQNKNLHEHWSTLQTHKRRKKKIERRYRLYTNAFLLDDMKKGNDFYC